MSDFSHDAAEDGFREIQLSGKQVIFLFMVLTVASAVIFLCGVLVGRNVRAPRLDAAESVTVATSTPTAADSAPHAAEPPPPATEVHDELSYHKRLQGETAPPEAVKPEAKADSPPASQPAAPPPAAAPTGAQAATTQPASAPPQPAAQEPPAARPGSWVVQVGAFGNAAAAREVVRQLSAKGYPAFLVNPAAGMPVIYRVQVGGYGNRSDADQVARRIEKEDQFKPVVRQNR